MRPALPHQVKGIGYCSRFHHPALFMEMRLGKTLVAIRACRKWGVKAVLVLAPLSVLKSWETELKEEGESWISSPDSDQLDFESPPDGKIAWVLVNFERLLAGFKACDNPQDQPEDKSQERRFRRLLARFKRCDYDDSPRLAAWSAWESQFDTVIVDESTRIKNPKAMITRLVTTAFRGADHRAILSGLPNPEGPLDFVEQFRFLHGRFMRAKTYWSFRARNFEPLDYQWVPKPGVRQGIKAEVGRLSFIMSRKEAGIGSKKIYSRRYIQPTTEQTELFDQVEGEYRLGEQETKYSLVIHSWLGRIAGGHGEDWNVVSERKGREVVTLLEGELRREPALVLFRFNAELRLVAGMLRRARIPFVWITGETSPDERHARRLLFQKGRARVALLQIKVCKYGLDFSRASTSIYYSNSFSLDERRQSEDRIIHPMKKDPLLYIDLLTRDSVDESLSEALRIKGADSSWFLRKFFQLERERIVRRLRVS